MKALMLQGDINHDSVSALLQQFNEAKDERIVLYLCSRGGNTDSARAIADFINRDPERFDVVGTWQVSSAALRLLAWLRCAKRVFPYSFAEAHLVTISLESRDLHNPASLDSFLKELIRRENEDLLRLLETHGLTAEEIGRIRRGETVFLDAARICEVTGCEIATDERRPGAA